MSVPLAIGLQRWITLAGLSRFSLIRFSLRKAQIEIGSGRALCNLTGTGKAVAAKFAIDHYVKKTTKTIGFGSGSTVDKAKDYLSDELKAKKWESSMDSVLSTDYPLDIVIEGADYVDLNGNCLIGGCGIILPVKTAMANSKCNIIIIDSSKYEGSEMGKDPGHFYIEVVGSSSTASRLSEVLSKNHGINCSLKGKTTHWKSSGLISFIVSCKYQQAMEDWQQLHDQLMSIEGVLETGIVTSKMIDAVVIGNEDGSTYVIGSVP